MSVTEVRSSDGVIAAAVREELTREIAAAGGNEVFFFGTIDDSGMLSAVEVVARGNATGVPAFLDRAGDHHVLIHNHPGGDLTPSPADLTVAAEAGARGLGFYVISSDAASVYRVVEPFLRKKEVRLDEQEIADFFAAGGALAAGLGAFEERDGQQRMAVGVARAFNDREVVAFEGGTGVGKSFAYLVPAILWAVRNRGRVVISTQTIALGEQLVRKDLPTLARLLSEEFSYSLIKGRSNYACRRKTAEFALEPSLFADDDDEVAAGLEILEHLGRGGEGSLSELPHVPTSEVWSHFESTTDQSLKTRCPHYRECFYYEARRRAFRSHIVVVNHHLFFADLALRRSSGDFDADLVVPGYRRVVFDEAHHVEDVAARHLGAELTRRGLMQRLGRLVRSDPKRGGQRGRLPWVAGVLREGGAPETEEFLRMQVVPRLLELRPRMVDALEEVRERVHDAFDDGRIPGERRSASEARADSRVLMARVGERPGDLALETIEPPLRQLRDYLEELQGLLVRASARLADEPFEPRVNHDGAVAELRAAHNTLLSQIVALERFLGARDELLTWVELDEGRRPNLRLRASPVRVAEILAEDLYRPLDTVVMTSATLSVDGRWDFLGDRLGWSLTEEGRFRGEEFPSPFDHARQVLLGLPEDGPPPDAPGYEAWLAAVVIDAARAVGGRTFVLFTNHQLLRGVAARARPDLQESGLPVLVQGTRPRTELLERFRAAGNAVLFGNQTYWEGVDVPGDALSCVIITRLPFRVPTHPLERARAEEVEARGQSAFAKLTLPQAVLNLKQGYGRLIRTRDDRGVVIITDGRIRTRGYGKVFLRSLPGPARMAGPWRDIHAELLRRFAATGGDAGSDTGGSTGGGGEVR